MNIVHIQHRPHMSLTAVDIGLWLIPLDKSLSDAQEELEAMWKSTQIEHMKRSLINKGYQEFVPVKIWI